MINKEIITLLPKSLAAKGYRFYFRYADECKNCRYSDICVSKLKKNHLYVVTRVLKSPDKDISYPIICPIIGEIMIPVAVKYSTVKISIITYGSISEDMTITFRSPPCDKFQCSSRKLCYPKGIKNGEKVRIKRIYFRFLCPLGYPLTFAEVTPESP